MTDTLEHRVAEALADMGVRCGAAVINRIAAALRATATVAYRWPSGDDANDALSAGLAALEGKATDG